MARSPATRALIGGLCALGLVAPTGYAAPARAALEVKTAQAKDFSRLEFHWAGRVAATSRRDGQVLTVRFSRDAKPDIAALRAMPPKWVKAAEARHEGGALSIVLTLADNADAKVGDGDGATFVNVFEKVAPTPAEAKAAAAKPGEPPQAAAASAPAKVNPLPPGGVVHVLASRTGQSSSLRFDFAAPVGAAVFQRGAKVWIVFDAPATFDLGKPAGAFGWTKIEPAKGADWSALRLTVPSGAQVSALGEGRAWTVTLGGAAQPPDPIKLARDLTASPAALQATVAGATRAVWLNDPDVGDQVVAVTALAPSKGLPARRDFAQMSFLPSAQGLGIEPHATDLAVLADRDLVHFGLKQGLALSPVGAGARPQVGPADYPKPAALPALVDFAAWSATGEGGFLRRYDALNTAASEEAGVGKQTTARMALARFLLGSDLSFEAIGALNALGKAQPTMMSDAEFRGLRGAAKVMAGRFKDAEVDFAAPALSDDPSANLWRGYIDAHEGHWTDARSRFAAGQSALPLVAPVWRARFAMADAQAALALNDAAGAGGRLDAVAGLNLPADIREQTQLMQARVLEAKGMTDQALGAFQTLAGSKTDSVAAPAILHATQIKLARNQITPVQAAQTYDGLRYRWRGDATEIETIRALGQLYLAQGRYREALEALRSAGQRLPDVPQSIQLQADLSSSFRALFLDGQADGLQPIQALALFTDFKELTPIGADGDLMVRNMVRRLVDVDLLDQAADLLKYQVDNRLDGAAKAQVATDLATIYLMNRQPEQALDAINSSRTTLLSPAMNAERRVVVARALMGLGRYDAAQEMVDKDKTKDADDIRMEIAWKSKAWPQAGALFEKSLGDRAKSPLPLSPDEESRLLKAGVAYSLAGDDAGLARLRTKFGGLIDGARNPEALRVAFTGLSDGTARPADFARITADNDTFSSWVDRMKQRFRDKPIQAAPSPTKTAAQPASRG